MSAHELVPFPIVGKFAEVRMVYCRRCGATQPVEAGDRPALQECALAAPRAAIDLGSNVSTWPPDVDALSQIISDSNIGFGQQVELQLVLKQWAAPRAATEPLLDVGLLARAVVFHRYGIRVEDANPGDLNDAADIGTEYLRLAALTSTSAQGET